MNCVGKACVRLLSSRSKTPLDCFALDIELARELLAEKVTQLFLSTPARVTRILRVITDGDVRATLPINSLTVHAGPS